MKVQIGGFPYGRVVAEVTGAELEVLAKVFARAKAIQTEYVGKNYLTYVSDESKSRVEFAVLTQRLLTEGEYEAEKAKAEAEEAKVTPS